MPNPFLIVSLILYMYGKRMAKKLYNSAKIYPLKSLICLPFYPVCSFWKRKHQWYAKRAVSLRFATDLFCVRLVLLPLSYKLVHQCKHQPCTTNSDKIDCQKSKCLPHVLQRRVRAILATLLLSSLPSVSRIISMISHKKYFLINLLV